jgi:PAS domain S-box-containing protein
MLVPSQRARLAPDLQADELFLYEAFDNNPDWVFIKDENFRFIYANKAFMSIYAPEERDQVIGRTMIENFPEDQVSVFLAEDRKAFANGYSELIEEITDYKGHVHTILTRKTRFVRNGQPLMLGICTDISSIVKKERELVESRVMLENFAAIAAHDLRSPLGAVLSCIEMIRLDRKTKTSKQTGEYLNLMQQSIKGMLEQIGSLLQVYRSSNDSVKSFQQTNLSLLLNEVQFNLGTMISESGAIIRTNLLPMLNVDRNLFRQLFHNLIENSLKYRSSNTPIIIIKYNQLEDGTHSFVIEDNGLGVKKDFLADQRKTKGRIDLESYGIGMALCKKIVQLHRGDIWIDETYTEGYRVSFTIPNLPIWTQSL